MISIIFFAVKAQKPAKLQMIKYLLHTKKKNDCICKRFLNSV